MERKAVDVIFALVRQRDALRAQNESGNLLQLRLEPENRGLARFRRKRCGGGGFRKGSRW